MKLSPSPTYSRGARSRRLALSVVAFIIAHVAAFVLAPAARALSSSSCVAARGGGAQEAAPQKQREADARAGERAHSIVRGRVVYDDTNRPVRRAQVHIFDPNLRSNRAPRMVWTNARGEFVVRNLPAGSYYVVVKAPGVALGFFDGPAAQREQDATTATIDGTNNTEVRVRIKRGGAISGKITYADGEPAAGATLSLRRKKDAQLLPVYLSGGYGHSVSVDDRGLYRIAGIPPGEYVVGAAEQKMSVSETDEDGGRRGYQTALSVTFYPGALSPQQATTVTVEAGQEVEDIDITLVERNTHAVSGAVVERGTQRPVHGAEVSLTSKDDSGVREPSNAPTTQTDEQGRWSLEEVQEGGYTLTVVPQYDYRSRVEAGAAAGPVPRPKFVARRQELQVAGGDIAGLVVEVSAGARVSGRVAVEGGKPLPPDVWVYMEPAQRGESPLALHQAQAGPDGTFTIEGLSAGDYHLTVRAPREGAFYAKSITAAGGADLLSAPLGVEEGAAVRGVRVVLSPDVATLTGRVLSTQGAPLRGAVLVLLSADPTRRRLHTARLHATTSADGGFRVSGAPGEYVVLVFRPEQLTREPGEAAVEARAASAPRVTLAPGESKRADFTAPGDK
ncbi:MAG TPA: carboxypeptidase regulatory-like domain-containing protein [Pyrinomonadaceae bacterium]